MVLEKSGILAKRKNLDGIQVNMSNDELILGTILSRLDELSENKPRIPEDTEDIDSLKNEIVSGLRLHLLRLGYTISENGLIQGKTLSKADLRTIQSEKRIEMLYSNLTFLKRNARKLIGFIANGSDVDPEQIDPEIIELRTGDRKHNLFRFLTLYWSVPVSQGYGRRMRFLVLDKQNGKIIGLFALGDPVFNLRVRDKWIGWTTEQRKKNLRSVLDAFVLGAIPPYSYLLGGKLVCALTTSTKVRRAYRDKYNNTTSVISKRRHDNDLLLITTTSALGKSSLYDRIKLNNRLLFIPVGYTEGYGHFQISQSLFLKMRRLLELIDHPYAKCNRFGQGPNWRMRVIRQSLQECNMNPLILKHSIKRATYVIPLAKNTQQCLRDESNTPIFYQEDVSSISNAALQRWIVPRAKRRPGYKKYQKWQFLESIVETMEGETR